VAQAVDDRGCADGTEAAAIDRPDARGGGHGRRLPASYPPAAGRLPVWPPADDPAPHPIVAAPLPRTARHQPAAQDGGRQAEDKRFADYAIGYFHIDIAEVRTEEGKLYLFVAIDRTSKLAFAKLEREANRYIASDFLRALIGAVPYQIHTVLTDNGQQFCHAPGNRSGPTARYSMHMFDRVCRENDIEHRLTKPNHPWTNGQVERMNRTLKEATIKRYHYESHDQLRVHLQLFLDAYNHARRLKTLRGLTPYEHVLRAWTKEPKRFKLNPSHHIPGPYS
jgi:transposase InsO family protein